MGYTDYYSFMGLSRDASQDAIKAAYRHLAQRYHPDAREFADAENLFKALGQAYGVLRDPQKRAMYDVYLSRQRTEQKPNSTPDSNSTGKTHSDQSQISGINTRRSLLYVFGPIILLICALAAEHTFTHYDKHTLDTTSLSIDVESVEVKEILKTESLSATAKAWR